MDRANRAKNRYSKPESESDPQKAANQILQAIKIGVDLVPKGANVDPLGVYRAGRQDEQKTFENAVKQGETNTLDVQIENMKQLERIDNKKLDFETEKWRYDKAHEGDTIDKVVELTKTVLESPIGKFISDMGGVAKDKIRGSNPALINVACPDCSHKFQANRTLLQIMCPNCAATLQAKAPEQPQTETPKPEPQPTESTPQEPEATQHTNPQNPPDVDITSDVPAKLKHATSDGGE
jgi:ribosomal protein S27E